MVLNLSFESNAVFVSGAVSLNKQIVPYKQRSRTELLLCPASHFMVNEGPQNE